MKITTDLFLVSSLIIQNYFYSPFTLSLYDTQHRGSFITIYLMLKVINAKTKDMNCINDESTYFNFIDLKLTLNMAGLLAETCW